MQLRKLQQYLVKQYKQKRQAASDNVADRPNTLKKSSSSASTKKPTNDPSRPQTNKLRSASGVGSTKQYSHRIDHYKSKPTTSKKDQHQAEAKPAHDTQAITQDSVGNAIPIADETDKAEILKQPDIIVDHKHNLLSGLNKMSRRHEHSSRVRQAHNAANVIQQAWRQHRSQKT